MKTSANPSDLADTLLTHCGDVLAELTGSDVGAVGIAHSLAGRWTERHRHWHGAAHLIALVAQIEADWSGEKCATLLIAALFHDAVYDPTARDNESRSAGLLRAAAVDPNASRVRDAVEIILRSEWNGAALDGLTADFFELDAGALTPQATLAQRCDYERAIFREYQFAPWNLYREKRAAFLRQWAGWYPQHAAGVADALEVLDAFRPRMAVYPGSFNPFHVGHLSVLRQAEESFDKVIVSIGVNRQKLQGSAEEIDGALEARRAALQQGSLRFHQVDSYGGLLTEYLERLPLSATLVRGVRDGTDLEAELRFSRFLQDLRPGTPVVWIGCEGQWQHVSSSAIRELESLQAGAGRAYVPDAAEIYRLVPVL